MGFVAFILMVVGWLLIIFGAFGSGLTLNVGNLNPIDAGEVLVLLALCIGGAGEVVARIRS